MLLDSNVIIYAARPEHAVLREFIADHTPAVSIISRIEVLGYHELMEGDRRCLERFFELAETLPLTEGVVNSAVILRNQRKMSLGDSIVAGTAIVHERTLATHNTDDFRWIDGIELLDPLTVSD